MDTQIIAIQNVHGYVDSNGTAWLNAEDVARGLGFTEVAGSGNITIRWRIVRKYLADFGYKPIAGSCDDINSGSYIPENMFYRLAMKARNETAERFQAKVADEILPQIRKTGSYSIINQPPMDYLEALKQLVAKEEAYRAEKARADENQEVKELYDTSVAQNNYWIPMKAVADILDCVGVGRTNLYRFLRDEGVLTSKNEPMRQYQENGFMKTSYYSDWLNQYVCVVSFKGLKFIFKKLKNANKIPRSTTFDDWVALCKDMVVQDDKSDSILTD